MANISKYSVVHSEEDREIGDYDYYKTISREEAEHDIMDAERIVKALEAYLKGIGI